MQIATRNFVMTIINVYVGEFCHHVVRFGVGLGLVLSGLVNICGPGY